MENKYILEIRGAGIRKVEAQNRKNGRSLIWGWVLKNTSLESQSILHIMIIIVGLRCWLFPNGTKSFVFEWAESEEQANQNMTEDVEVYPVELPEKVLLEKFKKDIELQLCISM